MTQGIASSNRVKKVQRGSTDDKNPKNVAKHFTLDVDLTILWSTQPGPIRCDVLDGGSVLIGFLRWFSEGGWTFTGQKKTEGDTFQPLINFLLYLLQPKQKAERL